MRSLRGGLSMSEDLLGLMRSREPASGEPLAARWRRLAMDFAKLPPLLEGDYHLVVSGAPLRDVGELLLRGHEKGLADAERYVVEGHTARTGEVVDVDDIDDVDALERWVRRLDRASAEGYAPPAPLGFWASYLHWRTPLGMARIAESRSSSRLRVGS